MRLSPVSSAVLLAQVPRGFRLVHRFSAPLRLPGWSSGRQQQHQPGQPGQAQQAPPPPPPPLPADPEVVRKADTLAAFVAKNGPAFEDLARQRREKGAGGGDLACIFLLPSPATERCFLRGHVLNESLSHE